MADNHEPHVYPGDLKENPGEGIPVFLKLTYVGFTIFGIAYWVLWYAGDGSNPLVKAFNAATGH